MRLLLAEDEPKVAAAVAKGLRRHGAAVDVAPDGAASSSASAIRSPQRNPYQFPHTNADHAVCGAEC